MHALKSSTRLEADKAVGSRRMVHSLQSLLWTGAFECDRTASV